MKKKENMTKIVNGKPELSDKRKQLVDEYLTTCNFNIRKAYKKVYPNASEGVCNTYPYKIWKEQLVQEYLNKRVRELEEGGILYA